VTEARDKEANGAWLKVGLYRASVLTKLSRDAEWAWFRLQFYSAADDNGGRLRPSEVVVALERKVTQKVADKLLAELEEHGLVTVDNGALVLPRFPEENPPADTWHDPVKRERWARGRRLLRDSELCKRIKDRDRHLCRYCGVRVNWTDKVGRAGGTYDHVDPDGDNSITNVVVACRACNGHKRDRTPDQWITEEPATGHTLKRPGTTAEQALTIDTAHREGNTVRCAPG
jgi:hypothetical protein